MTRADAARAAVAIPALDGEGPLWLQVRRALAAAILGGDWPAGTRLPTELALTTHYATARMTVNRALQSLASEGLVERRPRTGTVVTARAAERSVFEFWDAADIVRRTGGRYRYRLLGCAPLAAGDRALRDIGLAADAEAFRILCLHLSDDAPFQLEERLVNADAAPGLDCAMLASVPPGQWLLANVPWTQARHAVSARGASADVAAAMGLRIGDPCLMVERRTWNGPVPVTLGRFWYPGGDHVLEGEVRRSW